MYLRSVVSVKSYPWIFAHRRVAVWSLVTSAKEMVFVFRFPFIVLRHKICFLDGLGLI